MIVNYNDDIFESDFDIEEIVYLKVDSSGLKGMITKVSFCANCSFIYEVSWESGKEDMRYSSELTKERESY